MDVVGSRLYYSKFFEFLLWEEKGAVLVRGRFLLRSCVLTFFIELSKVNLILVINHSLNSLLIIFLFQNLLHLNLLRTSLTLFKLSLRLSKFLLWRFPFLSYRSLGNLLISFHFFFELEHVVNKSHKLFMFLIGWEKFSTFFDLLFLEAFEISSDSFTF